LAGGRCSCPFASILCSSQRRSGLPERSAQVCRNIVTHHRRRKAFAALRSFKVRITVPESAREPEEATKRPPPLRSARSDSKGYSEVRRDGGAGGWIDTVLPEVRSGYFIA